MAWVERQFVDYPFEDVPVVRSVVDSIKELASEELASEEHFAAVVGWVGVVVVGTDRLNVGIGFDVEDFAPADVV